MTPIVPDGGFFIMADTSHMDNLFDYDPNQTSPAMPTPPMPRDWALARWLTQDVGVASIPPSAFYSTENVHLAQNLLRFGFCKDDDTLWEAHKRLGKYFKGKS